MIRNKSTRQSIVAVMAAVISMAAFSGCHTETIIYQPAPGGGGNPPGGGGNPPGGGGYYNAWYDVYGNYCSNSTPMPGCNFYSSGYKIQDYQDPYYYSKYLEYSSYWTYTDSYGYRQAYSGWAWLSSTGILYDEWGRALNELDSNDSHDLLGEAAELESAAITASGKNLAGRFALAEDRAIEIAKTLNDWAVLGKGRARTARDEATFANRIYGVSLDSAKAALAEAAQGKLDALKDVNRQIAAYWGTNPETSQSIISTWYAGQFIAK